MNPLTWQNPEQLFVAQVLKKIFYNSVAELRYSTIASSKKLANGVKFYLKETGGFADVEETEIDGTKYQTKTANNVADVNDAVFIRDSVIFQKQQPVLLLSCG